EGEDASAGFRYVEAEPGHRVTRRHLLNLRRIREPAGKDHHVDRNHGSLLPDRRIARACDIHSAPMETQGDPPAARTFEAAPGITAIDTMMAGRAAVTAAYLIHAPAPALVETGPTASLPAVLAGLSALGVGPDDLAHVVVSHIHLDHAGGAGALLERFPRATLWVHARGAPHLVEPARLVASTIRSYGQEAVDTMFGPVTPVPSERLRGLAEGDRIELGGRHLQAVDAPGHSYSELFLVDSSTGGVFTCDGFGILLPDVGMLRPA